MFKPKEYEYILEHQSKDSDQWNLKKHLDLLYTNSNKPAGLTNQLCFKVMTDQPISLEKLHPTSIRGIFRARNHSAVLGEIYYFTVKGSRSIRSNRVFELISVIPDSVIINPATKYRVRRILN